MNSQPSSAIENGLTAQLMNSVTPMPRQCSVTWCSAPKSIFSSIGMIISQISTATGRLTWATSARADRLERRRQPVAERDAGDDAERHPERQVALEQTERRPRLSRVDAARAARAASSRSLLSPRSVGQAAALGEVACLARPSRPALLLSSVDDLRVQLVSPSASRRTTACRPP